MKEDMNRSKKEKNWNFSLSSMFEEIRNAELNEEKKVTASEMNRRNTSPVAEYGEVDDLGIIHIK